MGEKRRPRFELMLNHTATKFPDGGLDPCATTAALCAALTALGVPVEVPAKLPAPPPAGGEGRES